MTLIIPDWPAPAKIHALSTTRIGGGSQPPYHSFNLAHHVGDHVDHIEQNRQRLIQQGHLPNPPIWLNQIHGINVLDLNEGSISEAALHADAAYTRLPQQVCTIMTADCLPVIFCSRQGDEVAAAHAGWRGLCDGVLENCVRHFSAKPQDLLVWLGPAIGPSAFEVGEDVKQKFTQQNDEAESAFLPIIKAEKDKAGKYFADIYLLAKQRLHKLGIHQIYGGQFCTFSDAEYFYSYRREGITGRMATLIWFD